MTRQRERAGQREAYLLLRSPFVEALAVDPLGGAGAEARRDQVVGRVVRQADAAHAQARLHVRAGKATHRPMG